MLSAKEWWDVISNYNQSIYPMQWIVMLVGVIVTLYLIYGDQRKANAATKLYLSLCNLWIGIVFFMILGKGFPSPLKQVQGSLFIAIGALFAIDIFAKKTFFIIPKQSPKRIITIVLLLVVLVYPVVGLVSGHDLDKLIYPGTLPCPTTAFALVLILCALPKVNKLTYLLLLIWAIPFPPLIQIPKYHVYEDGIMFVIGVYALIAIIRSIIKGRSNANIKAHKELFDIKKDAVFATSSKDGVPNIVPIHSKHLISNNKVLISDQFMDKTKQNIIANPYGTLTIKENDMVYSISGKCRYKTSGFLYSMAVKGAKKYAKKNAISKNIRIKCKGIVLMKVDSFIRTDRRLVV